jgi:D-tyrosyl-tRNA(Tyr) deacylase
LRIIAQRVSSAAVKVDGKTVGETGLGLCLLVGVAPGDTKRHVSWAAEKIVNLRIFDDDSGRMNRSLLDVGGSVLVISQFTLYADCRSGRRPSFTAAAAPDHGNAMYELLINIMRNMGVSAQTGVFGAEMTVCIVNEGPVTIILDTDNMPK